jgi:hypothetical protein
MHLFNHLVKPLVISFALLGGWVCAAGEHEPRWVGDGRVAVRSALADDAAVLGHWTINTAVRLLHRDGEQCRARDTAGLAGVVPCAALRLRPVDAAELLGAAGYEQDYLRLFWWQPSAAMFAEVGRWMITRDDPDDAALQSPPRAVTPEFAAMKARLQQQGLQPDFALYVQRIEAEWVRDAQPGAELLTRRWWLGEPLQPLRGSFEVELLPTAAPSLLRRQEDLLMLAEAQADALVAMMQQPSTVEFVGTPEYVDGHYDSGWAGIGDMRRLRVHLPQPALLHVVGRDGRLSVREVASLDVEGNTFAHGCDDPMPDGAPLPGYDAVQERLFAFYLDRALPPGRMTVTTRELRLLAMPNDPFGMWHEARLHSIDLDRDGLADLAAIEIGGEPFDDEVKHEVFTFANIDGRWWLAGYEYLGPCGC